MDSLIASAARALATGDALGALDRVALRRDPPALALRGIAMAQLGELVRARELLRCAFRGFGAHEAKARARCVVAEAEVALALRELAGSWRTLDEAIAALETRGDRANAAQGRLIAARRLALLGRLEDAAVALRCIDLGGLPPTLCAVAQGLAAELALRALRIDDAQRALALAHDAAARARVPALEAEVAEAHAALDRPAARQIAGAEVKLLRLRDVAALRASAALVFDACRHGMGIDTAWVVLARRPVLFTLARALAEAWPGDATREDLIASAFRTRRPDETHRARLRVELGRLRRMLKAFARIEASPQGFALRPGDGREVVVLMPPCDGDGASLVALLSDGAAWSTSALALAMGRSQRSVQRALAALQAEGRVRAIGSARARRWLAPPLAGFTTALLLPAALPSA